MFLSITSLYLYLFVKLSIKVDCWLIEHEEIKVPIKTIKNLMNPIKEATNGSVVISPANLSTSSVIKKVIGVYPNLINAGDIVTVNGKIKNLEIYNTSGQKMKSSNRQTVSSQGLAKGLYIIKVTTETGEEQTSKFIVK